MTKDEFEAWTRDAGVKAGRRAGTVCTRAESEEERRKRIAAELEKNSIGCDASLLLISYLVFLPTPHKIQKYE